MLVPSIPVDKTPSGRVALGNEFGPGALRGQRTRVHLLGATSDVRASTAMGLGMKCPRCQHENPADSSFCLECGAPLSLACAACATHLPGGSKFCNKCGQPVRVAEAEPG